MREPGTSSPVEDGRLAKALLASRGQRNDPETDNLLVAASLTGGAHPNSRIPGRHAEDDVNLIPVAFSLYPSWGQGADLEAVEVELAPAITAETYSGQTDRGVRIVEQHVRRLMPVECERLMGWPDGWTAPPGVKASDSRRYAGCGDGVVAPVAEWIGRRLVDCFDNS